MKQLLLFFVFILFSLVFVDVAPAPPLPGDPSAAPVGGAIPSGVTVAAIALYGLFRMKK